MKVDFQEAVRDRIRKMAQDLKLSHTEIGDRLGLSRSAASRMLKGPKPDLTLDYIEKFAELFLCRPAELVADPGSEVQSLSPIELGVIRRVREMNSEQRFALLVVLDIGRQDKPLTKGKRTRLARGAISGAAGSPPSHEGALQNAMEAADALQQRIGELVRQSRRGNGGS